jgi:DNA-binding transcriptional ArsR family regulator
VWRIHFTPEDLARSYVAGPNPLWELVLSLHKLFGVEARDGKRVFDPWRAQARKAVRATGIGRSIRELLGRLAPPASYFPDFLTPGAGALGLDAGIDAVLSTSRGRLRTDLARVQFGRRPPGWAGPLARGDREVLGVVGAAMRAYFQVALEPIWPHVESAIDADRAIRAQALRQGGIERILSSLRPGLRWDPPVLWKETPVDAEVHLNGRGLVLVPSYFCWRSPIKLYEPSLPPVLVYPIRREVTFARTPDQLGKLLGATRSRILHATRESRTTGEIATLVGMSASSVSDHTAVLRDAGLIASSRSANTVVHYVTPLGSVLLGDGGFGFGRNGDGSRSLPLP